MIPEQIEQLAQEIQSSEALLRRNYSSREDKKLAEYAVKVASIKRKKERLKELKELAKNS